MGQTESTFRSDLGSGVQSKKPSVLHCKGPLAKKQDLSPAPFLGILLV